MQVTGWNNSNWLFPATVHHFLKTNSILCTKGVNEGVKQAMGSCEGLASIHMTLIASEYNIELFPIPGGTLFVFNP